MVDEANCHTENGLIQKSMMLDGVVVTISLSTGVCGESGCIIFRDTKLYPDDDSRSHFPKEHIFSIPYFDDMKDLSKLISEAFADRNKTLIKKKRK